MKEKVKINPSEFKLDVANLTYPELKEKYGLSVSMLKRVMTQLGIEKPRVNSAPFIIMNEDSEDVKPENLPEDIEDVAIPEPSREDGYAAIPSHQEANLDSQFGINS